ncbi:MAG: hypothetical protein AAF360_10190 [Pseudomonadota bacterium]
MSAVLRDRCVALYVACNSILEQSAPPETRRRRAEALQRAINNFRVDRDNLREAELYDAACAMNGALRVGDRQDKARAALLRAMSRFRGDAYTPPPPRVDFIGMTAEADA